MGCKYTSISHGLHRLTGFTHMGFTNSCRLQVHIILWRNFLLFFDTIFNFVIEFQCLPVATSEPWRNRKFRHRYALFNDEIIQRHEGNVIDGPFPTSGVYYFCSANPGEAETEACKIVGGLSTLEFGKLLERQVDGRANRVYSSDLPA